MAKAKKAKESARCAICGIAVADEKAGFVCQHFAHGSYMTYEASKPGKSKMGDTACTACSILYDEKKEDALDELNIHVVCLSCYQRAAKRNVLTVAKERKRGYAIVPRDTHAALQGIAIKLVAPVGIGTNVKLVFVPIPSTGREEYEMMWATIRSGKGDAYRGVLANEPRQFDPAKLKEGAAVTFSRDHIVAIEV